MNQDQCEACRKKMPSYDTVHYGSIDQGYRLLCTQCFNTEVVKQSGLDDFENIQLEPIGLTDCTGEKHQFHLRTRLLGNMVSGDRWPRNLLGGVRSLVNDSRRLTLQTGDFRPQRRGLT